MLYALGVAICVSAILQMGMWIANGIQLQNQNRQNYEARRNLVQRQIESALGSKKTESVEMPEGSWNGYRKFSVDRIQKEVQSVTSVYLKPVDGKSVADFKPGQHLTFRFDVPGESKPVVRCYSLSCGPQKDYYRISVKAVFPPTDKPDLPPGKVSNFVNNLLLDGDQVDVKAPAGSFYLDDSDSAPIVLLAGGIGITPMVSMIEDLVDKNSQRLIVLFYGVRNSREHTFKDYLHRIGNKCSNIHVVTCYSHPDETDRRGVDYATTGFVNIDLIKQLLPSRECCFYMCGPPPFMQSLYDGLRDWEVPDDKIRFEAFGPASIKKVRPESADSEPELAGQSVVFAKSNKRVGWSSEYDSILEMAESNGVSIESGCRAGSCGTCSTKILSGQVQYPPGTVAESEPGHCLTCVAKPEGDVELEI